MEIKEVSGSPFVVGVKIGVLFKKELQIACEKLPTPPIRPSSLRTEETDFWISNGWESTQIWCPITAEIIRGMSKSSTVPVEKIFLSWFTEIFSETKYHSIGCSDLVIPVDASQTGEIFIAHINDEINGLPAEVIRIAIQDKPVLTGVISGSGFSVIANSEGLVLSASSNHFSNIKPGIPKKVLLLEAAWSSSFEEILELFNNTEAASRFNYILVNKNGEILENYVKLESCSRKHEKYFLTKNFGFIQLQKLTSTLGSHRLDGFCNHDGDIKTKFSVVFKPSLRLFYYCPAAPCTNKYTIVRY